MSLRTLAHVTLAALAVVALGCQQATTERDVADAREDLREEQQDVADAKADAQADVAEEQQDVDAARREAMKPVLDENENIRDEQADVAEAQHDGADAVADEQQDVADAAADVRKKEAELAATRARDGFAADAEGKLAKADQTISTLKEKASNASGAEKTELDAKIDRLQEQRDRAEDAIDDLKSAELMKWDAHKPTVNSAMAELDKAIQEAE